MMKRIIRCALNAVIIFSACCALCAQETELTREFKETSVQRLNELMNEHYVFPQVAQNTADHLNALLKSGQFDEYKTLASFGTALTESVQAINKDKHMRIRPVPPYRATENTPEQIIEERLHRVAERRQTMAGFREAKIMEGNVGYLDLRGFAGMDWGAPVADHYMSLLSTADAIIIDLRKNGGGSPGMVQYLCSYFFDKKIHLNSLYWRNGDRTDEFWTLDQVGGKKIPDVPLFILTSHYTFSGAEEFSYNMQTQKRATLVGETTGGGANPGGSFLINEKLQVFIPTGRAINPVTKTNWEGIGVEPEVKTTAEEALEKAHELAKIQAENYRTVLNEKYKALLTDLQKSLDEYHAAANDETILKNIENCRKSGLLEEGSINAMGYDYLMEYKKPETAEAIFKINTLLFPESANVFDSYGEALAMNGKLEASVKSYEKAVELAKKQNDPNLELFIQNLDQVKSKIKP